MSDENFKIFATVPVLLRYFGVKFFNYYILLKYLYS